MSSSSESNGVHFFKIVQKTNLRHGELKVPSSFVNKHWEGMSNPVTLRLPNKTEWKVSWKKDDGDIWFCNNGWKEFAKYVPLSVSQLVVFHFEGNSCFNVIVLSKNGLEIKYKETRDTAIPAAEEKQESDGESDYSLKILDDLPSLPAKRPKSPPKSSQPHKKSKTNTKDQHHKMKKKTRNGKKKVEAHSGFGNAAKHKKSKTNKSGDVGSSSRLQNLPKHVQVKEEADGSTEALKKARNFRSTNPSFIFVMKPGYLYSNFLHVPSEFAKKYLKEGKSDVLLEVLDGRTWPCKYSLGRIRLRWKDFVSDNGLKVGDVSVFELIETKSLTFKVLIFRLGEEEEPHLPPPQGGKAVQRTSLGINSQSFANEAGEEANKFTSQNPFFTININRNRWGDHRQYMPVGFKRKYLDKKEIVLLQFGKNLWPVNLISQRGRSTVKLSKGWVVFTKVSKLQVGDACVFELINREDAVFDVHIFKGHSLDN